MFWPGHLAAGYLVALVFTSIVNPALGLQQINSLLLLGTLFGVAPDLDVLFFFLKNKSLKIRSKHRDYITHAPLIWLLAGLGIYFLSSDLFTKNLGLLLWLCSWSHFMLDSVEFGVMWAWPFNRKRYMIKNTGDKKINVNKTSEYYKKIFVEHYSKTPTFYLEILLILSVLIIYIYH